MAVKRPNPKAKTDKYHATVSAKKSGQRAHAPSKAKHAAAKARADAHAKNAKKSHKAAVQAQRQGKGENKHKPATGRERAGKEKIKVNLSVYPSEEVKKMVEQLASNEAAVGYLKKNVSKRTLDVMNLLMTPKTDEALATELDMKINAVRRILNLLQGYGVTNYYVSKNVNGWLSFAWYVNVSKLPPFFEYIQSVESSKRPVINSNCNDYFICNGCYERTKLIFTFDAAFEENFRCGSCGDGLAMIDREKAMKLVDESPPIEKAHQPEAPRVALDAGSTAVKKA